jgi:hypothetical protein
MGIALPQLGAVKGLTELGGGAKARNEWKKFCVGQKKICVVLFVGSQSAPEKKVLIDLQGVYNKVLTNTSPPPGTH